MFVLLLLILGLRVHELQRVEAAANIVIRQLAQGHQRTCVGLDPLARADNGQTSRQTRRGDVADLQYAGDGAQRTQSGCVADIIDRIDTMK